MRNLILLVDLEACVEGFTVEPCLAAFGPDAAYILLGSQCRLVALEGDGGVLWEAALPTGRRWISVAYVGRIDTVVCISREGDLVGVDCGSHDSEVVGLIESGVLGAAWSADEEVLTLVTQSGLLLTMTPQFEPLLEVGVLSGVSGSQTKNRIGSDTLLGLFLAGSSRACPLGGGPRCESVGVCGLEARWEVFRRVLSRRAFWGTGGASL
jgi:hypothetical protein